MPGLFPLSLTIVEEPGRETFIDLGPGSKLAFYLLALFSVLVFLSGFGLRLRKYAQGRRRGGLSWRRIERAAVDLASQRTVGKRDPLVRLAHFFVFWGFLVLLAATTIIAVDEDIIGLFFGRPDLRFWRGTFYVGYSLVVDVFSLGFIAGLIFLGLRRRRHPFRLDYDRVDREAPASDRRGYSIDDRAFLVTLLFLGVSGLLLEGFRIAALDFPDFEVASIAGWVVGGLTSGLGPEANETARLWAWWVHTLAALGFIAFIPYSKAMHMVVDVAGLVLTDQDSARRLPAPERPVAGVELASLTRKELVHFDACTKCGHCHEVCPARASGAPLSPRDLILDLREWADANSGIELWYGPGAEPRHQEATELAGGVIASETLWACTTCMACMEVCPVGIEHVPTIVGLRRRLVDLGDVEPGLQNAFQALARAGNSFGQPAKQRARWTKGMGFQVKDARVEAVDWLWFVGDYASFDPRAQQVSQVVARLLDRAGADFGILYDGERNSGNDVRRAGEEGLFEMLREQNLAGLASSSHRRIFTTDPHSLNALRNEYELENAFHYTQLFDELIDGGKLRLGRLSGKATYHDPCYLGRYAEEYEAPRRLIQATGLELIDMGRCRSNSFCCGAGGGRIWMDDSGLSERPSENRIREAVALGEDVRYFVVACPKDLVMYTDAVKTTGYEGRLEVVDVAQLLERALESAEASVG
ncbi:MAG: heterodisulfide reductase-related iron-sulfur binding cluster [Acidimicrobiia bacterium]|nr:heterodisulfide reductase-related iron-sulfur binding cluster [Acidimicrobiia bacterium]